jgi:pimeloyl-ACP methyl ester carboxylesterase
MTTFVLVSGAWHAGWHWERVVPLLEDDHHPAIAPDLPGMARMLRR